MRHDRAVRTPLVSLFLTLAVASSSPSQPATAPATQAAATQATATRPASATQAAATRPATAPLQHVHYDARLTVEPESHRIAGEIVVTLPPATSAAPPAFVLHGGLNAEPLDPAIQFRRLDGVPSPERFGINDEGDGLADVPLVAYEVGGAVADGAGVRRIGLRVAGQIHHPLVAEGEEYARSFSRSPGLISEEGIVLSGSSWWLPRFDDGLATFSLAIDLPQAWDAVAEGSRHRHEVVDGRRHVTWDSPEPMEEVHLIAARFTEYSRRVGDVTAYAFLREPDPNLAAKYLEATAQYIAMYAKLLGPYPFDKFALVENFWDTGYGMPSFTLLGSKIIRFPFILTSSYPHEILHNWWGNSVYVDYPTGNWCEGLTAYLADHMFKEGQGQGAAYRRDTLKRYSDHVRDGRDFPLTEFRSRHSSASEAVGYGKSLMLWHMVRMRLGDDAFVAGLKQFYTEHRFHRAGFSDLERAFSAAAGEDLSGLFASWVERSGAPELRLALGECDGGTRVSISQVQPGDAYDLRVPLAVWRAGAVTEQMIEVGAEPTSVCIDEGATQVSVDPSFDLFRRLDREEIPPALSELFGADVVTLVLPSTDPHLPATAWQVIADAWAAGRDEVRVVRDDSLTKLPADGAVWVLGEENRWAKTVRGLLSGYGAGLRGDIGLDGTVTRELVFGAGVEAAPLAGHSFVYVVRNPDDPDRSIGWVGSAVEASLPGLARKLPHYGKYSYLAFQGDEPTNVQKGQWPATGSPLVAALAEASSPLAALPVREPLARPEPVFDPARLTAHVEHLSGPELEGRGIGSRGLDHAADYIAHQFKQAGLAPAGDKGSYFQTWEEPGGPKGRPVRLRNVIAVLKGTRAEWSRQSVVLGAHYDHLGRGWPDVRAGDEGALHPGADDNASGVSVLLEVARSLGSQLEPERTVVFVAFSGEEWGLRGSKHYLSEMRTWPASETLAMVNLDTVGRLGDGELSILGAGSASEWIHIAMGIGFTTGIQSKSIMEDLRTSDQSSFLDAGIPAVHVFAAATEDYHRPSDTADKVDADGLVKVATWAREAIAYLSERDRPMTSKLAPPGSDGSGAPAAEPSRSSRPVSLGTLPEFAYPGPGAKVARVMPGTPAEKAGLAAGDVLLAIDGEEIANLRGYSDLLRKHTPGDRVKIRVDRGGEELTVEAVLEAR